MTKKQETMLNEVASRVGSALGVVAAEAAKIVRPLKAKGRKMAHSPSAPKKRGSTMRRSRRGVMHRNRTTRKGRSRRTSKRAV